VLLYLQFEADAQESFKDATEVRQSLFLLFSTISPPAMREAQARRAYILMFCCIYF